MNPTPDFMAANSRPGIYAIRCLVSGKLYIGSAVNIRKRWSIHRSELKLNHHKNSYLQRTYNKYGLNNLLFEVIEFVECVRSLIEREQFYMDHFQSADSRFGFNLRPTAGSPLGMRHTEESKRKIAVAKTGLRLSDEVKKKLRDCNLGKKHSEEARAKMSAERLGRVVSAETRLLIRQKIAGPMALRRKLSPTNVLESVRLHKEGFSASKIGRMFNVSYATILNAFRRIGYEYNV